ncbi:ScyD/ScyE family protein [Longitalea arenae]|uniref:ScyD/ScyE family protein n=1 Tax=Longitalea arenae TaxID=2812558 RepID=UPI001966DF41|nr:ScyD/ScyE family protein [Longitalea arenae]
MHSNLLKATFALLTFTFLLPACQKNKNETSVPWQLAQGLGVCFGSTVGPGSDLFVPDAQAGVIYRIDAKTGARSSFASGLPTLIPQVGFGGVVDVIFIGNTAYALVTLVDDPAFPTGQVNGIYRIDGPNRFTVIADIGAFNMAHPPTGFEFELATGVLYSIDRYRGGFLVTDGHLNRVLHITLDGEITVARQFDNIVPTGLAVRGDIVYVAQAGPSPHRPEDGKVVLLSGKFASLLDVASGAPLLVDVEHGPGELPFALSQGEFVAGPPGTPALPNTGSLVMVNADQTFTVVADELDIPTSLEIIGNRAYVITIEGEVWAIDNIARSPFGWPN